MKEQFSSKLLERAVNEFAKLPGIGRRTSLRLVLHLLRQKPDITYNFTDSLNSLIKNVTFCKKCHNIADHEICEICSNPLRDTSTVCVVENIRNVMSIENTGIYRGLYHVLGGVISPMDGMGPSQLEIESLLERIKKESIQEVIFALNPTMEGDTTIFYISKKLADFKIKITTLARGITIGDDIEYADEITLGRSIINRVEFTA